MGCSVDLMSNCSGILGNDFINQLFSELHTVFSAPVKTCVEPKNGPCNLICEAQYILFFTWWDRSINCSVCSEIGLDLGFCGCWVFFQIIPLVTVLCSTGTSHHSSFLLGSQWSVFHCSNIIIRLHTTSVICCPVLDFLLVLISYLMM